MPTYQLVFTRPSGGQSSNLADFPDDGTAIEDTGQVCSDEVISIAVGRGAIVCEVEWLGVWDWCDGRPAWTPEE